MGSDLLDEANNFYKGGANSIKFRNEKQIVTSYNIHLWVLLGAPGGPPGARVDRAGPARPRAGSN